MTYILTDSSFLCYNIFVLFFFKGILFAKFVEELIYMYNVIS
jgi:hypothetical protein